MNRASCIYTGRLRHRRFAPIRNNFTYRVFFLYLDLTELPELFADRWFWSVERPNLATFRRRDHLGDPAVPLDQAVRELVAARLGRRPEGPIRLLTHLRYFGYCFNPVSFYYCFDASGRQVEAVVAEIHNTPWGEEHCHVIGRTPGGNDSGLLQASFAKEFHVSPFMPMDIQYQWGFTEPGANLSVAMTNRQQETTLFDAVLTLRRRELNGRSLATTLLGHPPMTWKVTAAIYWQALRLKLKGAPFHPHPSTT